MTHLCFYIRCSLRTYTWYECSGRQKLLQEQTFALQNIDTPLLKPLNMIYSLYHVSIILSIYSSSRNKISQVLNSMGPYEDPLCYQKGTSSLDTWEGDWVAVGVSEFIWTEIWLASKEIYAEVKLIYRNMWNTNFISKYKSNKLMKTSRGSFKGPNKVSFLSHIVLLKMEYN
jgi:hypothetical protein